MTVITSPLENTKVGAIGESNTCTPSQSDRLLATASNGATVPKRGTSVDSTVQFIRAHYDSLFRRLAD